MTRNASTELQCNCCGHIVSILIGSSWTYPVYHDVTADIKNGKYGQKWKDIYQNIPDAEIDADMELYSCSFCRSFANENNLSIYVPKKTDDVPSEYTTMPFLQFLAKHKRINKLLSLRKARWYFSFRQIPYPHHCKECGKRMHLYRRDDLLCCPECKEGWMEIKDCWIY